MGTGPRALRLPLAPIFKTGHRTPRGDLTCRTGAPAGRPLAGLRPGGGRSGSRGGESVRQVPASDEELVMSRTSVFGRTSRVPGTVVRRRSPTAVAVALTVVLALSYLACMPTVAAPPAPAVVS